MRDTLRTLKTRLVGVLRTFGPVEAIMALFFASALWLPPFVGKKAYLPALAILVLYAVYKTIRERRLPPIPLFLVAYLGVYALATIHGGDVGLASLKQGYFVRPLTALVVATVVTTARQRMNVLILVVLFAVSQIPITAVQVSGNLMRYGRHATHTNAVDQVTGSLASTGDPHQGKVVALIALIAIAIVVSSWLWGRLKGAIAFVLCLMLAAIGAFSAARAAPLFVLVLGVALVAAALSVGRWRPPLRRVVAVGIASLAAAAAVSGLSVALYADLYSGINKERLGGLGRTEVLALSASYSINATLVASPPSVAAGTAASVTVQWNNVPSASTRDWIGLFHPGDADTAAITWIYDSSCSQTAGRAAKSSGSCSFAMKVAPVPMSSGFSATTRLSRSPAPIASPSPAPRSSSPVIRRSLHGNLR